MDNSYQEKFKNPVELLKKSWRVYLSKIKILLAVTAIPVGFGLLRSIFLSSFSLDSFLVWIIWIILSLLFLFFQLLAVPTLLSTLKEDLFLKEAYKKGLKIFLSYLWLYFLLTIIVVGGFLLFIIPGIIFSIWFSLAVIVLVFEEKRGLPALLRSKQLIVSKWWAVFWRFLVFGLILGAVFLPFHFLLSNLFTAQIAEKFNYLFQLFILPFGLIYHLLIYKNLKAIKEISVPEVLTKSRKIKYGLIALLGLLIVAPMVGLAILTTIFGKDEPPPDDRDLLLPKVEISTTENALYHFLPYYDSLSKEIILKYWPEAEEKLKESKEIYWPADKTEKINEIIKGREWDEELVKDILGKNNEFFEDFEKFIQSPYFQDPVFKDPSVFGIDLPLFSLGQYRTSAKLNLLRSVYLFKQGKEKEAFDETIKVIKMGQRFQDSPLPPLTQYLVGIAIKGMGLESLRAMVKETHLSVDLLEAYASELDQFYSNRETLAKIFKGEYITWMNVKTRIIDPISEGEKVSEEFSEEKEVLLQEFLPSRSTSLIRFSYFYKPNQTQRIFAEGFRKKAKIAAEGSCGGPLVEPLLPYSKSKLLLAENLIGRVLHDMVMVMVSLGGLFEKVCLEDFSVGGTKLLMAIKAYQTENGKLPDILDALVPEYILELPKDPFDGEVIRYSPEKKIIYSVGPDLEDSGGSEEEDWIRAADPTIKIEF